MFKTYKTNGHTYSDYLKLQEAISVFSELISRHKDDYQNYIASRLNDPKMCWSVLKTFCNDKKVLIIPPFLINNKLISDFEVKANYFNDFFTSLCTPLNNNRKIPETRSYVRNTKLSSIKSEGKDINNIIRFRCQ